MPSDLRRPVRPRHSRAGLSPLVLLWCALGCCASLPTSTCWSAGRRRPGVTRQKPDGVKPRRQRASGSSSTRTRAKKSAARLPVAEDTLARGLARLLRRRPALSLEDAISPLTAAQPQITLAAVKKLDHPLLEPLLHDRARPPRRPHRLPRVDRRTAVTLAFSQTLIRQHLDEGGSDELARIYREVVSFQRQIRRGRSSAIDPRDRKGAGALVRSVLEAIYARPTIGERTVSRAEVKQLLPSIVADRLRRGGEGARGPWSRVHRALTEEIVHRLIRAYRDQVLDGSDSRDSFRRHLHVNWREWQQLLQHFGAHFPHPADVAPSAKRIALAVSLLDQLASGELTTTAYSRRVSFPIELLRLLRLVDPRFANRASAPNSRAVLPNVRTTYDDPARLDRLSAAWKAEVCAHKRTINQFCREHGVSQTTMQKLRRAEAHRPERKKRFPDPPLLFSEENVKRVGKRAMAIYRGDVFIKAQGITDRLNADAELIDALGPALPGGRLTKKQYDVFRMTAKKLGLARLYPDLLDAAAKNKVLSAEIKELQRDHPGIKDPEIVRRMKKKHTRFKMSRLHELRRKGWIKAAFKRSTPRSVDQRREDVRLLKWALDRAEKKTVAEAAKILARDKKRHFKLPYLWRIMRQFGKEILAGPSPVRLLDRVRCSAVIAERLALLIRVAPPGLDERSLARMLDRMLEAEGLTPYRADKISSIIDRHIAREYGSLRTQYARTVSEIVAEYARVADDGQTEDQIIEAMLEHYPTLRPRGGSAPHQLTYWRTLWRKHPERFPALDRPEFKRAGKLRLRGLGQRVKRSELRFVGGWDIERALLRPAATDPRLLEELAIRSQYARIPLRLPLLDEALEDLAGDTPLDHHHVLWVTHLQATMVPLAEALRQAGMSSKSSIIIGTPYGANKEVVKVLRSDGFRRVIETEKDPGEVDLQQKVEAAVDEMVQRVKRTGKGVVVLDDGGWVAPLLHRKYAGKRWESVVAKFKIVEQTTRGITKVHEMRDARGRPLRLLTPIIDVAGALTKVKGEALFIGRSVAEKVLQGLRRLRLPLAGKHVVIHGYGNIGRATARALRDLGAIVTVIESRDSAYQEARAAVDARGRPLFRVLKLSQTAERLAALKKAHVVLGASGNLSVSLEDFRLLRSGAVVASTSSADVETAKAQLLAAAKGRFRRIDMGNPLVRLPTREYRLGRKRIILLGDGWPVNFDGFVEDVPAEQIQVTRALMFRAAIQAAGINVNDRDNRRIHRFDRRWDRKLLKRARAIAKRTEKLPIGDPDRWAEDVRRIAAFADAAELD